MGTGFVEAYVGDGSIEDGGFGLVREGGVDGQVSQMGD